MLGDLVFFDEEDNGPVIRISTRISGSNRVKYLEQTKETVCRRLKKIQ